MQNIFTKIASTIGFFIALFISVVIIGSSGIYSYSQITFYIGIAMLLGTLITSITLLIKYKPWPHWISMIIFALIIFMGLTYIGFIRF